MMSATVDNLERASARDGDFTQEAGDDRPVDLVHLAKYTMGNRSLEKEVLKLFCCQAELYVDRLNDASDVQAWQEAAHTLKGSARGIGAWDVADAADRAESLVADFRSEEMRIAVESVAERVAEANAFIRHILGEG